MVVHCTSLVLLIGRGCLKFWKIITNSSLTKKICFHLEVVSDLHVFLLKLFAKFSSFSSVLNEAQILE